MNAMRFYIPGLIGLCLLAILVSFLVWRYLLPQPLLQLPPTSCDLGKQACTIQLSDDRIFELELDPRPLPANKPLWARVRVRGALPDRIELDITGVGMHMPENRIQLVRTKRTETNTYEGEVTLPVCISGRMTWQATLLVHLGRNIYSAPFRFEAGQMPN